MKIEFEKDSTSSIYFAVSKMEVWKGKVHDELMWAEITPDANNNTFTVVWEDDYYNPLTANTLDEAKDHIRKNFSKHKPHINGASYNISR